jgi:hypothetical protein
MPIAEMMDKQTKSRIVGGGIWRRSRCVFVMHINVQ